MSGVVGRFATPFVCLLTLGFSGCGYFELPAARNVVLISIDSLRADHLSAYGYRRQTSPNIDALAAEGVLVETAVSTTSWTLPSHASMLTGLYPQMHAVRTGRQRISSEAVLLSERLQANGFSTYGLVSGPYLGSKFGFAQGFDIYDDKTIHYRNVTSSHQGVTSPKLHRRLIEILDGLDPQNPFFLFVHYWDVHYDYTPPPPYDTLFDSEYDGPVTGENFIFDDAVAPDMAARDLQHVIALYDGEIALTDHYLGELFSELRQRGLYDDTLVVLTSDHGDEFFDHGEKGHGKNLYGSTLNIPLIFKLPGGRKAGRKLKGPVSLVDLPPTVLDAVGAEIPNGLNGSSLWLGLRDLGLPGFMQRGDDPFTRFLFADLAECCNAVMRGSWKYQRRDDGEGEELFATDRDPSEQSNVIAEGLQTGDQLRAALDSWQQRVAQAKEGLDGETAEIDDDLENTLRALGYLD